MADGKSKKGGGFKVVLVVILLFVIVPILILSSVYYFSDPFKDSVNNVMSGVPGPIGSYFDALPTASEVSDQIKSIGDYMLSVETQRAVDKLLVLKTNDQTVYDQVIKSMLRSNPNRTENILEEIRRSTVKKDLIANTIEQINTENQDMLKEKAMYLNSVSTSSAKDEMNSIISGSINGHKDLANVLAVMDPSDAAKLVKFLSTDDYNKVMQYMEYDKANPIKLEVAANQSRKNELMNIADIYSTDKIEKLVDVIGNTNTYTLDELSVLYKKLGPVKAGKILAKVNNDEFVFSLMNNLKENEILDKGEDKITEDILNSLKIYKDIDDNIKELSDIYVKMSSDKVAALIQNLVRNSAEPKVYTLTNGENIVITDEDIALGVLKNFTQKKVSEILNLLDDNLSSDLSRKMTLPEI